MTALQKATLTEIRADERGTPVPGTEVAVQFNPASLKLQLANALEKQETRAQQQRQYLGKTSTTLSFDLYFDTADEGTTDAPVSVRTRTSAVERFVLPKGDGAQKERPPKVRFHWNELTIDGVIEDVSIDFDHFAADGTPLRAKIGVVIKEQDAKYQLGQSGPGANRGRGVTPPGRGGAGPGFGASLGISAGVSLSLGASASIGVGASASVGVALDGESAADFAVRAGLDPAAWRGVATAAGGSSLALDGGKEIDFDRSLTPSAGVGVSVGPEAGAHASVEAALGLEPRATPPSPAGVALGGAASAGFALAAAGGVGAAVASAAGARATQASSSTRRAFGASAAATPVADARATSFGLGVPLRPQIGGDAVETRRGALGGRIPIRPDDTPGDRLTPAIDPTTAPWTRLPLDRSRDAADRVQRTRRPARPCGCRGRCTHGGR